MLGDQSTGIEPFPPKWQKARPKKATLIGAISKERGKLLNAKFIEALRLSWVRKCSGRVEEKGSVCTCIVFTDLNKASLQDNFQLLDLDKIVDIMVGYESSFMDGYVRYNQILYSWEIKSLRLSTESATTKRYNITRSCLLGLRM